MVILHPRRLLQTLSRPTVFLSSTSYLTLQFLKGPLFFQLDEVLWSLNELYYVLLDVKNVKPEVAYSNIAIFTETREALLKYSHKKVSMFYGYIP